MMAQARSRVAGLGCALVVLGLVVGVPWWLKATFGWPLVGRLPDARQLWDGLQRPLSDELVGRGLVLATWSAWAWWLALPVVIEAGATALGVGAPRLPLAGGSQWLASELVAGVLLLVAPWQAGNRAAGPAPSPIVAVHPTSDPGPSGHARPDTQDQADADPRPEGEWHRVGPDESPWKIATQVYGRGEYATQIWHANAMRRMPSGRVYARPGLIRPGELLFLPTPETIDLYDSSAAPLAIQARGLEPTDHSADDAGEPGPAQRPLRWDKVRVKPGDTIWRLVQQRWPGLSADRTAEVVQAIEANNAGRPEPSFGDFEDADDIHPGWTVVLPPSVSPLLGDPIAPPPPVVDGEPYVAAPTPPAPPASRGDGSPEAPDGSGPLGTRGPASGARPDAGEAISRPVVVRLPSGSFLGAGFAAGVLLTHLLGAVRRRRAYLPSDPQAVRARQRRRGHRVVSRLSAGAEQGPPSVEIGDALLRSWVDPREARPLDLEAGTSAESTVAIDPISLGCTRIEGDGAVDATRAIVVSALLRCPAPDLRVLMDEATATELFASATPMVPGIDVLPRASDVLDEVQAERVRRTRVIDRAERDDFEAYRAAPTDELLEPLLVVGRPGHDDEGRWSSLAEGGRLGIGAILLGENAVAGSAVDVASDGAVVDVDFGARHLEGAALYRLTEADSEPILQEIREARAPADAAEGDPAPVVEPFPLDALGSATDALVRLRLLGPMTIEAAGGPVRSGLLDKARELCAYLALHPEGARRERILEDIWGDVDIDKRQDRFSAAVSNLRRCVRAALGAPDLEVVCFEGDRYRLEDGLCDVDLWRFQSALASDADVGRLHDALTAYRGDFVQDAPWEWVDDDRESLRHQALNAAVKLAVKYQVAGRIEEAIGAVDHAIETIDPYAEHLYVRGVELLVAAGRIESAQALYDRLKSRLERLRDEPTPDTTDAIGELLADGRRLASLRRTRSETTARTEI